MSLAAAYLLGAQRASGACSPDRDPRADDSVGLDPLDAVEAELARGAQQTSFPPALERQYQSEQDADRSTGLRAWLRLWGTGQSLTTLGLLATPEWSQTPHSLWTLAVLFGLSLLTFPASLPRRASWLAGVAWAFVAAQALVQFHLLLLPLWSGSTVPALAILSPFVTLSLLLVAPLPVAAARIASSCVTFGLCLTSLLVSPERALVVAASALTLRFVAEHVTARIVALRRENFLLRRRTELRREARTIERAAMDRLAKMDSLTGLFNRRAFDACLVEHLIRAQTTRPVCVALLDVDYFKGLNDAAGHLSGDECLRRIGAGLRKAAGDAFVARYGGEEFAVLFETDASGEDRHRLEALREAVLALDIAHPGRPGERVTVSIGATLAVEAENGRVVLDRADTALYRAKAAGRNRVDFEPRHAPPAPEAEDLRRLLDAAYPPPKPSASQRYRA